MKRVFVFSVVAAIVLATGMATQAAAQTGGSARPFQGLFGGAAPDPTVRQTFDVSLFLAEVYDDDAFAELHGGLDPRAPRVSGYYTTLLGNGEYQYHGDRLELGATAASALRYYRSLKQIESVTHSVGLGLLARLPKRTTLLINQRAAYAPSYLYGLFPGATTDALGAATPAAPDYANTGMESYSYGTAITLSQRLTRRNTLSGTAEFEYTDFLRNTVRRRDLSYYGGRAQFSRVLARRSTLTVGYRARTGDFGYGTSARTTEHAVDVGFDYTRPLSATRRLILGVRLGPSTADIPEGVEGTTVSGRQLKILSEFSAACQFGRTWEMRGNYTQGTEYIAELRGPVFVRGSSAAATGLLTRRIDFRATAGYASGESMFNRNGLYFNTYTGDAQIQYAFTRHSAAYIEYLYYFYEFRGSTPLPTGVPRDLERNSVRVGLSLWVPVVNR